MLNIALAQEIAGNATHFGKTWCYPSQQTLLDRLRKHHGQTISRRTLNRHMDALEAAGWIRRQCRHHNDRALGWVFRSTLYVVLGPLWRMVKRMMKTVAHAAKWTRVPKVAHNVTPTGLKSSPGSPAGPPGDSKKVCAAEFAAQARQLLAR